VYYKRGNLDSAVKLYEKLCALYAAERWNGLLASVLPRLSECQRLLGDVAGHLGSCMRLLALEDGLLSQVQRRISSYWSCTGLPIVAESVEELRLLLVRLHFRGSPRALACRNNLVRASAVTSTLIYFRRLVWFACGASSTGVQSFTSERSERDICRRSWI
jgi:hypothetical protein